MEILIYVLDGEIWGMEGENRQATENDVENWGEEYNIELGDWIGVVGDDFLTGDCVGTILVTAEELENLNQGEYPRHLENYENRMQYEDNY